MPCKVNQIVVSIFTACLLIEKWPAVLFVKICSFCSFSLKMLCFDKWDAVPQSSHFNKWTWGHFFNNFQSSVCPLVEGWNITEPCRALVLTAASIFQLFQLIVLFCCCQNCNTFILKQCAANDHLLTSGYSNRVHCKRSQVVIFLGLGVRAHQKNF